MAETDSAMRTRSSTYDADDEQSGIHGAASSWSSRPAAGREKLMENEEFENEEGDPKQRRWLELIEEKAETILAAV